MGCFLPQYATSPQVYSTDVELVTNIAENILVVGEGEDNNEKRNQVTKPCKNDGKSEWRWESRRFFFVVDVLFQWNAINDWCEDLLKHQSLVVDGRQISRCVYVFSFHLWHRKASAWNNFEAKDVRKTIGKPFLANSLCLIPTPTFPNQHHGCKREFVCLGSRRITTQKHRPRPSFQSNKFSCINLSLMPRCSQARKSSSIEVFYPKSPNVYFKQPFAPRA